MEWEVAEVEEMSNTPSPEKKRMERVRTRGRHRNERHTAGSKRPPDGGDIRPPTPGVTTRARRNEIKNLSNRLRRNHRIWRLHGCAGQASVPVPG